MDAYFAALRASEFARLDASDCAYLDYTGAGLYAESQIRAHSARLLGSVYGNPHSAHDPSRWSAEAAEQARSDVLRWLDADPAEYTVVFTANATAALRLVGESYPFDRGTTLVLSEDNHNSVNGLREFARRAGAPVRYLPLDDGLGLSAGPAPGRGLFAFPAQSNFSGVRHPLDLITDARRAGYDVVLDAAAFVSAHALSLRAVHPEFVAVSFYKVCGHPTGVGALVARHDALRRLRRPWFAGGTVELATVDHLHHRLRPGAEGFEDGTSNFLALSAVSEGLAFVQSVGVDRLATRVSHLTARLGALLADEPTVRVYGPAATFNVLDARGRPIDFQHVERVASVARVAIRGGCFCNPGAAARAFAHDGATGALRASVGIATTPSDLMRLVTVIRGGINVRAVA